jgi:hypothetical protein
MHICVHAREMSRIRAIAEPSAEKRQGPGALQDAGATAEAAMNGRTVKISAKTVQKEVRGATCVRICRLSSAWRGGALRAVQSFKFQVQGWGKTGRGGVGNSAKRVGWTTFARLCPPLPAFARLLRVGGKTEPRKGREAPNPQVPKPQRSSKIQAPTGQRASVGSCLPGFTRISMENYFYERTARGDVRPTKAACQNSTNKLGCMSINTQPHLTA